MSGKETLETPSVKGLIQKFKDSSCLEDTLSYLMHAAQNTGIKPIDVLLGNQDCYETRELHKLIQPIAPSRYNEKDPITPEQRAILVNVLIDRAENPEDLITKRDETALIKEDTLNKAINFGRAEIIPALVEKLGPKVSDLEVRHEDFVQAGNPVHCPKAALPVLKALLPYIEDENVNVTDSFGKCNAGHSATTAGDLDSFQWLEEKGLDKNAISQTNVPTYAHRAAQIKNPYIANAFIKHLHANGYKMNELASEVTGQRGWENRPIETAASEGLLNNVRTFMDCDVPLTTKAFAEAVVSWTKPEEIIKFIDYVAEQGLLDADALIAAANRINDFSHPEGHLLDRASAIGKVLTRHAQQLSCADQLPVLPNADYVDAPDWHI